MTSPRPGDRVRITCEGVVTSANKAIGVRVDGMCSGACFFFSAEEQSAPTFHLEVLPRPLEVGDRVTTLARGYTGNIVHVSPKGDAAIQWDDGNLGVLSLSDLKPLEPTDGE